MSPSDPLLWITLVVICLAALALVAKLVLGRRSRLLRRLLDAADQHESLLIKTRERMAQMKQVVGRVPQDIGAVAHASLDTDALVREGLRDLLGHRLWIASEGQKAPTDELARALQTIERAAQQIESKLRQLENAGAELDDVTQAAIEQAAREPAALRRGRPDLG